jgi:hypothetical protein
MCSAQIQLLEAEKARLTLASDKFDMLMQGLRQRINERRLDRLSHNRVFQQVRPR